MARTELFSRRTPGGVYNIENLGASAGARYFVSSITGSATGGYSPDGACLTIAQALALCTENQATRTWADDRIYLLPGHTEVIAGAAGIACNVAGVSIIGLGTGRLRPIITYSTSTAAQMTVTGAQTLFRNVVWNFSGFSAVVAGISVTAADVAFEDCEFVISEGTNGVVLGILTAATAARLRVERCRFIGPALSTDTTTACIKHEVGVDYLIKDCYFTGKMTQAILNATALLRGVIDNNRFVIATGTLAISVHASSTPFISNNRINVPSGTTPITAAAGFVAGNIYSAAAGVVSTGETSSTSSVSRL